MRKMSAFGKHLAQAVVELGGSAGGGVRDARDGRERSGLPFDAPSSIA